MVVALSLASLFLPVTSAAGSALYAMGVALFGGFLLFDTQRIVRTAPVQQVFHPVLHLLSQDLDSINI